MKTLPKHCHHDVPSEASDTGEILRQLLSKARAFTQTARIFRIAGRKWNATVVLRPWLTAR